MKSSVDRSRLVLFGKPNRGGWIHHLYNTLEILGSECVYDVPSDRWKLSAGLRLRIESSIIRIEGIAPTAAEALASKYTTFRRIQSGVVSTFALETMREDVTDFRDEVDGFLKDLLEKLGIRSPLDGIELKPILIAHDSPGVPVEVR